MSIASLSKTVKYYDDIYMSSVEKELKSIVSELVLGSLKEDIPIFIENWEEYRCRRMLDLLMERKDCHSHAWFSFRNSLWRKLKILK